MSDRCFTAEALLALLALAGCAPGGGADPVDEPAVDVTVDTDADTAPPDDTAPDDTASPDDTGSVTTAGCEAVTPLCAAGTCTVPVAVETVALSGAFSPGPGWALRFRATGLTVDPSNPLDGSGYGLETPFASFSTWPTGETYTATGFAGTWDVTVEEARRGDSSPTASFAVAMGVTLAAGSATLDAALDLHAVSGTVALDGAPLDVPGTVRFENPVTGEYAESRVSGGAFATVLPDGAWDVTYTPDERGTLALGEWPLGTVAVAGGDATFVLELPAVEAAFTVRVGGDVLEGQNEGTWPFTFIDADGAKWTVGLPGGRLEWTAWLPEGTYTAVFSAWVMGEDIVVTPEATFDLADGAVPTTPGTLSFSGTDPPFPWSFRLYERALGLDLARDAGAVSLPPGTYDIYAVGSDSSGSFAALVAGNYVVTDTPFLLDVPMANASGEVSWDDGTPHDTWRLLVVDDAGTTSVVYATALGGWDLTLPVGTYDVYAEIDRLFGIDLHVPVARGFALAADTTHDLSVETVEVGVTATLDGAPVEAVALYAHDEDGGDTLATSFTGDPATWSQRLPAGTYTFLAAFSGLEGTAHFVQVVVCGSIAP